MKQRRTKGKLLGQTALEYFITYSWAVLLVAIVAALAYSRGLPDLNFVNVKQANLPGFTVLDFKADSNGDLTLQIGNSLNRPVQLTGTVAINGQEKRVTPLGDNSLKLEKGQTGTYIVEKALPPGNAGEMFRIPLLTVRYIALDSGIEHASHGFATGKREKATFTEPVLLFEWKTQGDFNNGNHSGTKWKDDGVTILGATGEYVSDVRDAGAVVNWDNLAWSQETPFPTEVQKNVVGWWGFDEAQCAARDKSGRGNNALFQRNCPTTFIPGVTSYAACLNGINEAVNVSNSEILNVDNMSVELWVYDNSTPNWYHLVEKGHNNQYRLGLTENGQIRWLVSGVGEMYSKAQVKKLTWTHVLATYRDNKITLQDEMKIYINGQLDSTYIGYGTAQITSEPLTLGATQFNTYNFKGCIDEVRIYSGTLNDTEAKDSFRASNTIVKLQARSCNDEQCNGEEFTGPDSTPETYYSSPTALRLSPNKYVQFKAMLSALNTSFTPKLKQVVIRANR